MGSFETYYECLNVPRTASNEQILNAYRQRILETHPDKGGNSEDFQKVRKAYAVLSDPEKKMAYDRSISAYSIHTQPEQSYQYKSYNHPKDSYGTAEDYSFQSFKFVVFFVLAFVFVCSKIFDSHSDNEMDASLIPYNSTETYSVYKQDSKGYVIVYVYDLKSGKALGWYYRDRVKKSYKTNTNPYRSVMFNSDSKK